ncbi:hypothetical protein [Caldimonas brevitalea]|uniref:Inner membrane transmembrane protein n=1 Tax=Caldimonas brevitalea TaxID=413882 RepID=A0A0G3BLQ2_9BURK|nr:hypothetical protein [Caldimonas brevitalea]AKJ28923.1 inner membrane transmembrane protein [Caldimonas brevitalea]
MNHPSPAIVTQRAAQRLPRLPLLLLCAAYVLPGLFGRDPWRSADVTAFGFMHSLATGRSDLWHPLVGGLPPEGGLLPYWLGAGFIRLFADVLDPALAARIPFALLLVGVLLLTWYTCYHLARTQAAQPVSFAFGGEATPVDYARAIADGAVLALLATLGLLQLGHETTPELLQLSGVTLFIYALAASGVRSLKPRVAVLTALPLMAGSGAPNIAVFLGLVGLSVCWMSHDAQTRRFVTWVAAALLLAALTATTFDAWAWKADPRPQLRQVLRLLAWFTWPAWPLVAWTLWVWRRHWLKRHIAVPLFTALIALVACVVMNGSDRALMLALPSLAVLAGFSLPTLRRGVASAIDWFSVFFFSFCALTIWVIYLSMHTNVPAKPAANIARLAPGFEPLFSVPALVFAVAGTLAWLWLVRWRAGRNREELWRSLVLPASGVALGWLLLMTLWLPALDYGRSERPLVQRLSRYLPYGVCLEAHGLPRSEMAALEVHGGFQVYASHALYPPRCDYLLVRGGRSAPEPGGWTLLGRAQRPTDRSDFTYVFRRHGADED